MRLGIYTTRVTETDDIKLHVTKKDSNNSQLMTDNVNASNLKRSAHPVILLNKHNSSLEVKELYVFWNVMI